MATTGVELTETAWVDLGACPLSFEVEKGRVHLVIDTVAPASLTAKSFVVGAGTDKDGVDANYSGQHVYARSGGGAKAFIVVVK